MELIKTGSVHVT